MTLAHFAFDWPKLVAILAQFWLIFMVFCLFFFYLDKPINRKTVTSLLSVSFSCALALWLLMIFMVMLRITLNESPNLSYLYALPPMTP